MNRDVIGLRDQAAACVANCERKVAAGIEDLRIGGAKHGLAHLLHDRTEAVLNDRTCNGIDFCGHSRLVPDRRDHSKGGGHMPSTRPPPGGQSATPVQCSAAARISAYKTPASSIRCFRAAARRAGSWDR